MFNRKLLLLTLLTVMSWLGAMAQNVVNVNGDVISVEGEPQSGVNILVTVYFADSTVVFQSVFTDTEGAYSVNVQTPGPNFLGWLQVSMVDCWGTNETQYFTILNGNEIFDAEDFIYCQEIMMDSCTVFILEEWNPNNEYQLTAWIPPGLSADYLWSSGESTQSIVPSGSGEYCVTATFASGCVLTDCIYVIDSFTCFAYIISYLENDSTTTLEAIAQGTAPFTYTWSTGETTSEIHNVQPGTYCVEIMDASGCLYTSCIIVDDLSFCEVYIYVEPSGGLYAEGYGTPPVSYIWSTGDSTQVIFPNTPGVYCVTMYDNNGCTATSCIEYGTPVDSCFVYINPIITDSNALVLQAVGYTPSNAWEYLWNTGETTEYINADPNESYCVTMTDAEGCVSSACFDAFNYCYAWVQVTYLDSNTAVIAALTDPIFNLPGNPPPTYLWSDGSTDPTLTVSESGEYCVTVTAAAGCVTHACGTVDFEGVSTECAAWVFTYPDSSGNWLAEGYGWGAGTFSYLWSNGDTNQVTQINSPSDLTCVTVTSSLGCVAEACTDTFFLPCEAYISIHYTSDTSADLIASLWNDPSQNATFEWSTGETGPSITVTEEGIYCVTTMANGCVKTTCVDVQFFNVDPCGVWITSTDTLGSGTLYIANAWGVAPYSYAWSNGSTDPSVFIDFGLHDLCVTITDATGCVSSACNYPVDSCYIGLLYSPSPIPTIYVQTADPVNIIYWSTGDTLPWLEISQPGTYCATLISSNGCNATACITIDSLQANGQEYVINGYVYGDTLAAIEGNVYAYTYDPNSGNSFEIADSAQIINGYYSIGGLPDGIYLVKAEMTPGTESAEQYLPTYHYWSTNWEEAQPHVLPNWLPVTTDIYMIRATGMNGGGVIGGVVTDPNHLVADAGEESRGGVGLSDIVVLISDAAGVPFNYKWSLEDGSFRFTDLPWGTYRISYDIAGLTSPDVWVTLTPEDPERLQVNLIVDQETVAVEDPGTEEIILFPNPARNEINIPLPDLNTSFDIRLMDMQGKVVSVGSEKNTNGVITIEVGSFAPGLYHVSLKGDQILYYGRFIKQE